jgi:hypothetical protein
VRTYQLAELIEWSVGEVDDEVWWSYFFLIRVVSRRQKCPLGVLEIREVGRRISLYLIEDAFEDDVPRERAVCIVRSS